MRIAVFGATGKTGGAVADKLLARKHTVRALVRDAGRAAELADRGAQICVCDVNDEADVYTAIAGADAVYYCSPIPLGYERPFEVEQRWGGHVIDAAKAAGVTHLVLLSVLGPESAPESRLIDTKRVIEARLTASGVPYTVLRASMFMDNLAVFVPDVLRAVGVSWPIAADAPLQPVAVDDIASVAVAALESGPRNRSFDVVGPEPLTLPDMTRILGEATGIELAFTEMEDDIFAEQLGTVLGSVDYGRAAAATYRLWQRDGSGTGDAKALAREFEVELTSFEVFSAGLAERWRSQGLL